eukprot:7599793-Pyramimonas_sp.AAC.1
MKEISARFNDKLNLIYSEVKSFHSATAGGTRSGYDVLEDLQSAQRSLMSYAPLLEVGGDKAATMENITTALNNADPAKFSTALVLRARRQMARLELAARDYASAATRIVNGDGVPAKLLDVIGDAS